MRPETVNMGSTKKPTSTSSKKSAAPKKESNPSKPRSSDSKKTDSENKSDASLHKRSRSGKTTPASLLGPNSLLILNAPASVRVLYLPIAKKEVRRKTSILLSLHQSVREMRVYAAVVVGNPRRAEYAEGKGEEQDQTD